MVCQLLHWRRVRSAEQAAASRVCRTSLCCDGTAARGAVVFFKGTYCSHFRIMSRSLTQPLWAFHSLSVRIVTPSLRRRAVFTVSCCWQVSHWPLQKLYCLVSKLSN